MKICFFAPANNYHTKKWANWFSSKGHEVHVVSFIKDIIPGTTVHYIDTGASASGSDTSKLKYLMHAKDFKRIVDRISPDIVNVHYATSYGTVAALSGIRRYILSVWGSDIYDFPKRSILHKTMLEFSLKKATKLFSTSHSMAKEARKYTNKQFAITPFGVDMSLFNPCRRTRGENDNAFVVGTVKSLSKIYGIEYILKAVAKLRVKHPEIPISVRIAGKGEDEAYYKQMTEDLGIKDIVTWLGFISQEQVAVEWANMDVAIIPSVSYESYGVSAIEAQACGTPVIVSNVDGLLETTIKGISSIVVPVRNADSIADNIVLLYRNYKLRKTMGENGRKHVINKYELDYCFKKVESIYKNIITTNQR